MQSIGERLEEARKKKGVSIREAAEATKIRGDFLDHFENDNFDIGVPDIYVRGFLTNYARFLKVDPAKIVTDFNAFKLGGSKLSKRDRGDTFGRFDLPEKKEEGTPENGETHAPLTQPPFDAKLGSATKPGNMHAGKIADEGEEEVEIDYTLYWKAGLAIAVVVVVFLLIIWVINLVINQDDEDPAIVSNTTTSSVSQPISTPVDGAELLMVSAKKPVKVYIYSASDPLNRVKLFSKDMEADESFTYDKTQPIALFFTDASAITYELNGKAYSPSGEGPGRVTLP